jgi:hypothetical protein
MKLKNSLAFVTFSVALSTGTAETPTVYFCVVDQLVGIQKDKESSGVIKPKKEKFILKYSPARYLSDSKGDSNPMYTVPKLETSLLSNTEALRSFYFSDLIGPFSLNGKSSGRITDTIEHWGNDKRSQAKVLATERKTLDELIRRSQNETTIGSYSTPLSSFGVDILQVYFKNKTLHGLAIESTVNDPKLVLERNHRLVSAYLHYFTCETF